METGKLELKDIAGYLPYGLNAYSSYYDSVVVADSATHINDYNIRISCGDYVDSRGGCFDGFTLSGTNKVILRPISDLYKTITHNGKEIVPIVELAKICYRKAGYLAKIQNGKKCFVLNNKNAVLYEFSYSKYHGAFYSSEIDRGMSSDVGVHNQVELFDYLHELKIDYRGLIDAGLAINANKLENNPYKYK